MEAGWDGGGQGLGYHSNGSPGLCADGWCTSSASVSAANLELSASAPAAGRSQGKREIEKGTVGRAFQAEFDPRNALIFSTKGRNVSSHWRGSRRFVEAIHGPAAGRRTKSHVGPLLWPSVNAGTHWDTRARVLGGKNEQRWRLNSN